MKKNIVAVICGIVAAVIAVTGSLVSFGRMEEKDSIGSSSALTIALNDAGVSKEQAKNVKSVFEKENRKYVFDVEFDAGDYEYDYDIDAFTGEILKRSVEKNKSTPKEKTTKANTEETTKKPKEKTTDGKSNKKNETKKDKSKNNTAQAETSAKYIGLDKAKKIALKNSGFSAGSVRFTKAKLDYEDGIAVYEVEFVKGNTEYEYEISAKTGKIIDFERETRKTTKKSSNTKQTTQSHKKKSSGSNSKHYDDDEDDDDDDDDDDD